MTKLISGEEMRARVAAARQGAAPPPADGPLLEYRHYKPLAEAADGYIAWARTPEERIYLGIPAFDQAMRGIAPGEMTLIVGYAHSGKTVLTTECILNNRDRRIALFTPDETRTLILIKLACLIHEVSASEIEMRIAAGDETAVKLVRSTATEHFPNLAVFDQNLTLNEIDRALDECEDVWDGKAELVIYDFLDLLHGAGEDTPGRARAIKSWGKNRAVPLIVLHQSSRGRGADGAQVTISSGAYGGEQEAIHMIGVRRKKNEIAARIRDLEERIRTSSRNVDALEAMLDEARYDLERHRHTITFSLVKNKRPPGHLVDDMDFRLDADTGRIESLGFSHDDQDSAMAEWVEEELF